MPMTENVPVYWCAMGLNLFLCAMLSWMLLSREPEVGNGKKGKVVLFGLSFLLLGAVLGLFCAKAAWLLIRINYAEKRLLSFAPEEFSYYGGMAGIIAAAVLSALIARIPIRKALNAFAPRRGPACGLGPVRGVLSRLPRHSLSAG